MQALAARRLRPADEPEVVERRADEGGDLLDLRHAHQNGAEAARDRVADGALLKTESRFRHGGIEHLDLGEGAEFEILQRHTVDGSEILRRTPEIPTLGPIVAFEHHLSIALLYP